MENKKKCLNCLIELNKKQRGNKYCSVKCSNEVKMREQYQSYLNNQEKFCYDRNMGFVKQHILEEQNKCCDICKLNNEWNEKNLVFTMDHIDGNASNNKRINLRLICPNCDSQLYTFKSKNKNSTRRNYLREKIERKIKEEINLKD